MKKARENSGDSSGKVLGLVIVDGVGYRNFILSGFVKQALNHFEELVIYSGLPSHVYHFETPEKVVVQEIPLFEESRKTWFWRKSKEVAHMQRHKSKFPGIRYNLKKNYPQKVQSLRARMTRLIFGFTAILHSEAVIKYFYRRQLQSFSHNARVAEYFKILKNKSCDILFFTHQRPPFLAPLVYNANRLSIKTSSFIFSWDNLASKGRMAAAFDSYVVWSDLMKNELLYFYPETQSEKIKVEGTPQFEPYVLPQYDIGKADFLDKFNLDPSKKTICYSCGDISTSLNDSYYIESIAKFIHNKELVEEVNFLVRTSPAEDGSRFKGLVEEFSFIKWNFPKWELSRKDHPEVWSQRVPSEEDIADLKAILRYSDLGINMCSTMSLDFMTFDKPVINPVFGNGRNGFHNDQKYLEYSHYRKVVESGAVALAGNLEELLKEINFSLKNPQARLKEQRALLALQIGKPLEGTSNRIAKTLRELA